MFDLTIAISGPAGAGMQSISFTLAKTFTRAGYSAYIYHDLMSRIRGGNNTSIVRLKTAPVNSSKETFDLLVVLDKEAAERNRTKVKQNGFLVFDGDKIAPTGSGENLISVPLEKLALEAGKDKITINSVATGAVLALLGSKVQTECFGVVKELFASKGEEVVNNNIAAIKAGFNYVLANYREKIKLDIEPLRVVRKRFLLTGSEALGLGAIAAGVKFYAGYPMSPSTAIMEYIAARAKEYNIAFEQAEDEIAAINMAIGAGYGGVRSMTATSGGGFALMIEGVSLAGMTETPVVIVIAQRPGPATGFPTRTEQGDLNMALHAGHGDFARVILAPRNAAEAVYIMSKAFNYAEKYQIPVIVLTDQCFNDSSYTVNLADVKSEPPDRGEFFNAAGAEAYTYKRYELLGDGCISKRMLPGTENQVVYADSDEHTMEGHISEDGKLRERMTRKRLDKYIEIAKKIDKPIYYGEADPKVVFTGWGSSYGALREAADLLNEKGIPAAVLHFNMIFPLPEIQLPFDLASLDAFVCVENNVTGQFADIFEKHQRISFTKRILRYDGRPLTAEFILDNL